MKRTITWIGFATILCGLVGCGPKAVKLSEVKGRVTFKSQPVAGGAKIVFDDPTKGISMTAEMGTNGDYRIEMAEGIGLPPGTYAVAVYPPPLMGGSTGIPPDGKAPKPKAHNIPLKYQDFKTSGLKIELGSESVIYNVDMVP